MLLVGGAALAILFLLTRKEKSGGHSALAAGQMVSNPKRKSRKARKSRKTRKPRKSRKGRKTRRLRKSRKAVHPRKAHHRKARKSRRARKGPKWRLQSIRLPKSRFTKSQAKAWVKKEGRKHKSVESMKNFWSFRQESPKHFVKSKIRTTFLSRDLGIQGIVGEPAHKARKR
jgi:hypothetical protein